MNHWQHASSMSHADGCIDNNQRQSRGLVIIYDIDYCGQFVTLEVTIGSSNVTCQSHEL
jgi:hypothetical protein